MSDSYDPLALLWDSILHGSLRLPPRNVSADLVETNKPPPAPTTQKYFASSAHYITAYLAHAFASTTGSARKTAFMDFGLD